MKPRLATFEVRKNSRFFRPKTLKQPRKPMCSPLRNFWLADRFVHCFARSRAIPVIVKAAQESRMV